MLGVPVACDRRAGGHPRIVLGANVLEETVEGARSARPSDNAAMKSDRHHSPAFRAQLVERVHEIGKEVVRGDEPVRHQELEIVRVERVRDDEVVPTSDLDPVRQLVSVRVRVVGEASLLDDEPSRAL